MTETHSLPDKEGRQRRTRATKKIGVAGSTSLAATLPKGRTRRLTASVTELIAFQGCRRRWYLGRMYSSPSTAPALWFGNGVHVGLEAYFKWRKVQPKDVQAQTEAMLEAYHHFRDTQMRQGAKEYGMIWEQASRPFEGLLDIGEKMLLHYVEYDNAAPLQLYPLTVERRLFLPLNEAKTDILTMRFDLLARTEAGLLAIVDHKTSAGQHASGSVLDLDEQLTGYAYGYWRIKNRQQLADLVVYDVLKKQLPQRPRRSEKTGKLSHAVDQLTKIEWVLEEINRDSLDPSGFAELLATLRIKGWTPYFTREASSRTLAQVVNYERRVQSIMADMRTVLMSPDLAYPSPGPIRCASCPFLTVCNSMEREEDASEILEAQFTRDSKTPWSLPTRFREITG